MPATTKVQLGAATTVRKWYLDVNTGTAASPTWVGVFGITKFQSALKPTLVDTSDFDSGGDMSSMVTARQWSLVFGVDRKSQASVATAYDPGQEFLRNAAENIGLSNSVQIRWYEMEPGGPRVEAYMGTASVEWSPDGGAMSAAEAVTVTLTGMGKRTLITHPDTVASVPTVYTLSPTSGPAAGGTLVTIKGTAFTGTTGVKFGTATASFTLVDQNTIVANTPAVVASTVNVIVTNATGPSTGGPTYTFV